MAQVLYGSILGDVKDSSGASVPARQWLTDKGVLSSILGGWQINNMFSVMSGVPFTVYADGTSLNLPGSNQTADQVKETVILPTRLTSRRRTTTLATARTS